MPLVLDLIKGFFNQKPYVHQHHWISYPGDRDFVICFGCSRKRKDPRRIYWELWFRNQREWLQNYSDWDPNTDPWPRLEEFNWQVEDNDHDYNREEM